MRKLKNNRHSFLIFITTALAFLFSAPAFISASGGGGAVGFIEGNFTTNSRGAAVFQIPLKVAPGTKNLHPQLNLVYNSQNNANGMLGVGWGISGLSTIDRCGKVRHLDGRSGPVAYNQGDRLCRDGRRMVPRNAYADDSGYWNNSYRLEIEDQSETVASGRCGSGPCTFTVNMPRGHQMVYGGAGDSRVTHRNGTVRSWHLSQIRDRNGNTIDFHYMRRSGTALALPERITYGNREVRFFYEGRRNIREFVRMGDPGQDTNHRFELRDRLTRIEASTADGVFKRYKFSYAGGKNSGSSLLSQIEECDAANNCLEPTTIAWHNRGRADFFNRVEPSGNAYQNDLRGEGGAKIITGDFNGDGKTDFLRQEHGAWAWDESGSFHVYFSNGNGTFNRHSPGGREYQGFLRAHVATTLISAGDLDGDGRGDFIAKKDHVPLFFPEEFAKIYYSNGNGTFQAKGLLGGDAQERNLFPGDYNGDGIGDVLMQSTRTQTRPALRIVFGGRDRSAALQKVESNHARWFASSGAVLIPGDFNGDGNTDIYLQYKKRAGEDGRRKDFVYLNSGNGRFSPFGIEAPKYRYDDGWRLIPVDINGDGKTDFIAQGHGSLGDTGPHHIRLMISKGDGTFEIQQPTSPDMQWRLGRDPGAHIIPLDYNGDGKTDFIRQERGGWDDHGNDSFKIYISRGDGSFDIHHPQGGNYVGKMPGDLTWLHPGDYDGDGRSDFIRQEHGIWALDSSGTFQVYFSTSTQDALPETVDYIQQGPIKHDITLKRLNGRHVGAIASFPAGYEQFRGSMLVVDQYIRTAPGIPAMTRDFAYIGPAIHRGGRGFAGFQMVTQKQAGHHVTWQSYHIEFPYTGRVHRTESWNSDRSQRIQTQLTKWSNKPGVGPYSRYVMQIEKTNDSFFGNAARRTQTRTTYDAHGTAILLREIDAGRSFYTCSNYSNDDVNGTSGKLAEVIQSDACNASGNTCSCSGKKFSHERYEYDGKSNISEHRKWDDSTGTWLAESYEHDSHGNRSSITDAAGQTERFEYDDTYNTFPKRVVTEIAGAIYERSYSYDARFGAPIESVDENGIVARNYYDSFGKLVAQENTDPEGDVVNTMRQSLSLNGGEYVLETRTLRDWDSGEYKITRSTSNASGKITREEYIDADAGQNVIVLTEYDSRGRVRRQSNPHFAGQPVWTTYDYNAQGQRIRATYPNGSVNDVEYRVGASCGANRVEITSRIADRTMIGCENASGDRESETFVSSTGNAKHIFEFDAAGRMVRSTDGAVSTLFEYDTLNRRTRIVNPERGARRFVFGADGRLQKQIHEESGDERIYTYGRGGDITRIAFSDGSRMEFEYDLPEFSNSMGRLSRATMIEKNGATSSIREYSYDTAGNAAFKRLKIDGQSYTVAYESRPDGGRSRVIYPSGRVADYQYNSLGSLHKIRVNGEDYVEYSNFSAAGQAREVSYKNGVRTRYEFDPSNRVRNVRTLDADDKSILDHTYEYTALNEVKKIDDRLGIESSEYVYNQLGYMTEASGTYGVKNYAYSANGNLIRKAGVDMVYEGNALKSSGDGGRWEYDSRGNLVKKSTTEGEWTYEYTGHEQIGVVRKNGLYAGQYYYDAGGERVKKVDSNNHETIYVTAELEVTRFKNRPGLHTEYLLGPSGRVTAISENSSDLALWKGYEQHLLEAQMYNLASAAGVLGFLNQTTMAFVKHPISHRVGGPLFLTMVAAILILCAYYGFRSARRSTRLGRLRSRCAWLLEDLGLLDARKADAFAEAGAQASPIAAGSRRRFAWAAPLLVVSLLAGNVNCGNSSGGDMFATISGDQSGTGGVFDFLLEPGLNGYGYPEPGVFFFQQNQVGSTSVVTDEQGKEAAHTVYKPFGDICEKGSRGRDIFRNKFNGKEWDRDAGLYYFNARYYDPATARFVQADSYLKGTSEASAAQLNHYAFAANNPITYSDPSGNVAPLLIGMIVLTVAVPFAISIGIAAGNGVLDENFGKSIVIGVAIGLLGLVTGGAMMLGALAYLGTQASFAAVMAAGLATGVLNGAATGALASTLYQLWVYESIDATQVGIDAGIGAAVGLVDGFANGWSGWQHLIRKNYLAISRSLPAQGEARSLTHGLADAAEFVSDIRHTEKVSSIKRSVPPARYLAQRATVGKYDKKNLWRFTFGGKGDWTGITFEALQAKYAGQLSKTSAIEVAPTDPRVFYEIIRAAGRNDAVFNILGKSTPKWSLFGQGLSRGTRLPVTDMRED